MSGLTLNQTAEKRAAEIAGTDWKNPRPKPGNERPQVEPKLMTVRASDVTPEELDWLWQHRFLTGHINIIGGDPGLGKSMLLVDMAARASSGRDWPDGSPCKQCSVLYSTTEDGIADTVVPRLIAAGADLERVHIVEGIKCRDDSELPLFLNEHLIYLDDMLTENPEIGILIIDTLQSHIGSAVATNNNSSVRGVMTPLKRLAEKHHVAVLCIEHLTKSKTMSGENATYRVQGSIAFAGAARSVWIVAKDQEDSTGKRRYMQASKTNLAPDNSGLGLAYEICGPTGKPYIRWLETDVATPIDQLLRIPDSSGGDQSDGGELGRCCDWLRDVLTVAMPAKELEAGAKSEMISAATLRRAKSDLGIRSEKKDGRWYWVPSSDMEQSHIDDIIGAAES
jgi:putative DNA primase/helicase